MNEKFLIALKQAAGKLLRFARQNKVSTVLALLVIVLLLRPRQVPQISGNDAPIQAEQSSNRDSGVSTNEALDPVLTIENGQPGANPKWLLPANLSTAQVQQFAAQIKQTYDLCTRFDTAQKHYMDQMGLLLGNSGGMFSRLQQGGFKDQKLAADWYAIVKDMDGIQGLMEISVQLTAEKLIELPMYMRLMPLQIRAVGGKPLVGDILFLKAFQGYLNYHVSYYEKMNATCDNVVERLKKEFPDDSKK